MKTLRRVEEWLMVVAVLGIILAALVPRLTLGPRTRAKEASARAQVVLFSAAIEAFKVDNGDYPSGTHALASLFRLPANAPHWHGPYLEPVPKGRIFGK